MTDYPRHLLASPAMQKVEPAGSGHEGVELARDLLRNKRAGTGRLYALEGLWAYEKLKAAGAKISVFLFCPGFIKNQREEAMVRDLAATASSSYLVSRRLCQRLSGRDEPEGFFLVCELPFCDLGGLIPAKDGFFLIADGLDKPGNIGTIVRSAEGAGCDGLILCESRVRLTNPLLIKASMGAAFTLPLIEEGRGRLLDWLAENRFRTIAADAAAARKYYGVDYAGRIAIVLGNENRGIPRSWYDAGAEPVAVPMHGCCDSLNVASAAAIIIYEAMLQRRGWLRR